LTTAETPSQQGGQLPLHRQQRHLRIYGTNAIATRLTRPLQWWQESLRIDDDYGTIATKGTMPDWGQQQCHCNKDNNAIADQGQQCHCYKDNDTSSTTARTPAHQQGQWYHYHEGNNCNCNNSKDAYALMATTPSQWGQQHQLDDKQQGQWRQLDKDRDACASTTAIVVFVVVVIVVVVVVAVVVVVVRSFCCPSSIAATVILLPISFPCTIW
jgi:hypothetical protein